MCFGWGFGGGGGGVCLAIADDELADVVLEKEGTVHNFISIIMSGCGGWRGRYGVGEGLFILY